MKQFTVGIIGAGNFSRFVAQRFTGIVPENYSSLSMDLSDRIQDIHLVDPNTKSLLQFASEFNIPYENACISPEMVDDPLDAVFISVPADLHYSIAKPYLEKGIPTFLSKPLETNMKQAKALVDLAEQTKTPNYCGTQIVHHPAFQDALQYIQDEDIQVNRVAVKWNKNRGPRDHPVPGITLEEGSHPLTLVSKVLGHDVKNVHSSSSNGYVIVSPHKWSNDVQHIKKTGNTLSHPLYGDVPLHEVEMEVASRSVIEYANGAIATVESDSEDPYKQRSIQIIGHKKGDAHFDRNVSLHVNLSEVPPQYEHLLPEFKQRLLIMKGVKDNDVRGGVGDIQRLTHYETPDLIGMQLSDFLDYLGSGVKKPYYSSFADEYNVDRLVDKLIK